MKSKKKLLIAMAAMSAAAIGAGTVSTFAWFTVTNGGAVMKNGADESVTVNRNDYSVASVDLPVNIDISPVANTPAPLELAHYFEAGDVPEVGADVFEVDGSGAGLYSAYKDHNGDLHYKNGAFKNTNALYRIYKIEITAASTYTDPSGQEWNQAAIRNALASRTARAALNNGKEFASAAGIASIDVEETYYTRSGDAGSYVYTPVLEPVIGNKASYYTLANSSPKSRARFYASTSSTPTIAAAGTDTLNVDIALTNINESGQSYKAVGYFALYVEGVDAGDTSSTETVSAAFVCTLTDITA